MTITTISLDFETRSRVDLKRRGVYSYAQDPSTDVWCMAWAIDDGDVQLWKRGDPFPEDFAHHVFPTAFDPQYEYHVQLRAWNAQFERVIWREILVERYGFPEVPLNAWYCTMADAGAMGLPRALGHAAKVLKIAEQKSEQEKDEEGHKLALRMSRPRSTKGGTVIWWDVPQRLERLYEYCKQDVRTERGVARVTRRLGESERKVYLLDQQMNDRGVLVDVTLARQAKTLSEEALSRANDEIARLTAGAVTSVTRVGDLKSWLGTQGVVVEGVKKSIVRDLLGGDALSNPVRLALEMRAEAGRSSVAKIETMLEARCDDNRIRGMLLYHGAGTGRWSGKLVQPQNFPRPEIKNVEQYIENVRKGDYDGIDVFHPVLTVISGMLRSMLRASPGHRFMAADFAQIEARVLAWLAGQTDLVKLFANKGKVYETFAANLYKVAVAEITKDDPRRQFGKNMVLGCGFQMGAKTYQRQAKEQMGIEISDEFAQQTITAYRELVPNIVQYWYDLDRAAWNAVKEPGKDFSVGASRFVVRGGYLWLILPSKRPLAYASPRIEPVEKPWGETQNAVTVSGINSVTRQWARYALYGGLITENIVQATARDLLAMAMLRLEEHRYPNVLTIHDEVVCDVPNEHGTMAEFTALMAEVPEWARGCPVAVEGWEGERYRK